MATTSIPQPSLFDQGTPPDPHDHAFRGFTLDTTEDEAAASFQRRYGRPPEYIVEALGILLVGPIPAAS